MEKIKFVVTGQCKDCTPTAEKVQNRRSCHGCVKYLTETKK